MALREKDLKVPMTALALLIEVIICKILRLNDEDLEYGGFLHSNVVR
jgi:hypothetical protein